MTDNRTNEMRSLLKERGVGYKPTMFSTLQTAFTANGIEWIVTENEATGELFVEPRHGLTPEQAIAATLGSSTCEPKWTLQGKTQTQEFWRCECGNCGYEFGVEDRQSFPWHVVVGSVDVPNFCPECGMKQKAVER